MSRVALITGATEGIGYGVARAFAARGWTVHIVGRNNNKGAAVLRELRSLNSDAPHKLFLVDLSTIEANEQFLGDYIGKHDQLDYVLLNAMVYTPETSMTSDNIETSFAVGTLSRYMFTVRLSPMLAKTPGSRLAYMTMTTELPDDVDIPSVTQPGLDIFKAELQVFLTHSLMTYFFKQDRLTSINIEEQDPGLVWTRQLDLHPPEMVEEIKQVAAKDATFPEEYGQIIAHHVESTDAAACAGFAFLKGQLQPYGTKILGSRDHFYELMAACEQMTGVSYKRFA